VFEPLALFPDGRGRFEPQSVEDALGRRRVRDGRLVFLAGFGLGLQERPLVGEFDLFGVPGPFAPDPQGLVGGREVSVGGVVVGVGLGHRPEGVGPQFRQSRPDRSVVGPDLDLDLVHAREVAASVQNPVESVDDTGRAGLRGTAGRRLRHGNVVLKSATPVGFGMSNESEADEAEQDAPDEPTDEADPTSGTDETAEEATDEGLQYGDFARLDYTARTVEGGDLVDTTDPEVAEEEGVGEDQEFGPRTIVLGEGHVFGPVEEAIVGSEVGDEGSVTVAAEDAFGEVDEDEIRTISADRIPEDDRYPGAHVEVDGQRGHVSTIIGGRARVDFNHPLAGEDIEYEYEILDEVVDREAKAQALIETVLGMELELWFETDIDEEEQLVEPDEDEGEDESEAEADAEGDDEDDAPEPEYETVEVEKDTLYIEATPQLTMNQQWMMGKQQIAQQLVEQLGVDRVIVQETLGEGMGMGGLGGMMGGMGGGDIEEALEDEDVDAEEIVEELEEAGE